MVDVFFYVYIYIVRGTKTSEARSCACDARACALHRCSFVLLPFARETDESIGGFRVSDLSTSAHVVEDISSMSTRDCAGVCAQLKGQANRWTTRVRARRIAHFARQS